MKYGVGPDAADLLGYLVFGLIILFFVVVILREIFHIDTSGHGFLIWVCCQFSAVVIIKLID